MKSRCRPGYYTTKKECVAIERRGNSQRLEDGAKGEEEVRYRGEEDEKGVFKTQLLGLLLVFVRAMVR